LYHCVIKEKHYPYIFFLLLRITCYARASKNMSYQNQNDDSDDECMIIEVDEETRRVRKYYESIRINDDVVIGPLDSVLCMFSFLPPIAIHQTNSSKVNIL
jgi:hypothetical protein